jgi:hypothetical protein
MIASGSSTGRRTTLTTGGVGELACTPVHAGCQNEVSPRAPGRPKLRCTWCVRGVVVGQHQITEGGHAGMILVDAVGLCLVAGVPLDGGAEPLGGEARGLRREAGRTTTAALS